jgi:prefoldin subunit 5
LAKNGDIPQLHELLQLLAVYQTDLLAEVEALLRTLNKMQSQIERLRRDETSSTVNDLERAEALNLLAAHVTTLGAKIDTFRAALPAITETIGLLQEVSGSEKVKEE